MGPQHGQNNIISRITRPSAQVCEYAGRTGRKAPPLFFRVARLFGGRFRKKIGGSYACPEFRYEHKAPSPRLGIGGFRGYGDVYLHSWAFNKSR